MNQLENKGTASEWIKLLIKDEEKGFNRLINSKKTLGEGDRAKTISTLIYREQLAWSKTKYKSLRCIQVKICISLTLKMQEPFWGNMLPINWRFVIKDHGYTIITFFKISHLMCYCEINLTNVINPYDDPKLTKIYWWIYKKLDLLIQKNYSEVTLII